MKDVVGVGRWAVGGEQTGLGNLLPSLLPGIEDEG